MGLGLTLEDVVPYQPVTLDRILRLNWGIHKEHPIKGLHRKRRLSPIDERLVRIVESEVLPSIRNNYPNLTHFNCVLKTSIPVEVSSETQLLALKSWMGYLFPDFGLPTGGEIDVFAPVRKIGMYIKQHIEAGNRETEISKKVGEMMHSAVASLSESGIKTGSLRTLAHNPDLVVKSFQIASAYRQELAVKFGGLIQRLGYTPIIDIYSFIPYRGDIGLK